MVANQTTGNVLIPVVVGGPQDLFVPNLVRANVGDVVQFQFSNGNHTVTQSPEAAGCQPMQATDPNAIHSGHIPFQQGQLDVGTFSMVVQSAEPMFLYCATGPHCQIGQVMVINPYVLVKCHPMVLARRLTRSGKQDQRYSARKLRQGVPVNNIQRGRHARCRWYRRQDSTGTSCIRPSTSGRSIELGRVTLVYN